MSSEEARTYVAELQQQRGVVVDRSPVGNMDQLLEVLASDQIGRFAEAKKLVEGKPGMDAMTLHGMIELAWSDDFSTLALILDEARKRADAEVKRLSQKRDTGIALTPEEEQELERQQKNVEVDGKTKQALDVLAEEHLKAGSLVVSEAVRQFPQDAMTHRAVAYHSLLAKDFRQFDTAMTWLKDIEDRDAGILYLRALETLNRYGVRKDTTALLQKALQANPKMVRAQVKLVLTVDGVDAVYAELEKLRAMAPQHPLVALAGPSIKSNYELSTSFRRAQEARQPAPPPAPAPDGAAPAPAAPPPPAQ